MVQAMPISIRPLQAADWPQWHRLWTGYLEFYETVLPEATYVTSFGRMLSDDPNEYSGLVAEGPDGLVGLAHYLFHRHGWKAENVCYLQDLYADPSVRGSGVGRKLIEAVYRAADDAGAPAVYWMTQEFNTTARQLYDRIATLTPFVKYSRF